MQSVEFSLLPRIQCLRFTAVGQRAEHAGLVHLYLGADGQHRVIPYSLCLPSNCCCSFADTCVQFGIQGKVA